VVSPVLRIISLWCSVVALCLCAWGWIENSWAASFGGPYLAFLPRSELFFWLLCLSLLISLLLAWRWIWLAVRECQKALLALRRHAH